MTKRPLFTFGPQPPHDEDFDPLLGRSVSDDALAAATDEDNQPVESAASAVSERMDPYSDWFNIQLPGPSAPDGPTAASEADSATPVWTPFKVKQASSPERLDGSPPDASPPPEPSGIDTPDDGPAQSMPPAADEPADAFNTSHEAAGAAETTRQNLTEPAPSVRLPWDDEPILGSKPVPTAPPTQPTGLFGWRAVPVEDWDTPATPKPPVDPWERITAPVRGDIAAASPETDQTTASDPSSEPHPLDGAETTETASAASMVNSGQPKEATPETVDAGDSILDLSHIARPDRVQPEMPEEAATEQDVPELDVPEPAQELEAPFLNSPPVSESDREEVSVSAEAPGPEDPPMVLDESRLAPVLDAPDSAPIAAASRTKPEEAALLEPDPTGYEQTEPEQTRYDQIERAQDERVQAAFARLRAAAAGVTQPFGQERQPVESPALASQPSALTETGNEGAALADPPIEPAYDHPDAPVEPQFDGPAADTGDPDLAEAEAEAEAGAETRTEDMPEGVPVGSDEPVTGAETGLAPVAEEEPASSIESGS
nr:hypothetical protein [Hyphomonadaceae bacterium]